MMRTRTITMATLLAMLTALLVGPAAAEPTTAGSKDALLEAEPAPVTGTTENGGTFEGTFTLKRFKVSDTTLYAEGTLEGTVSDPSFKKTKSVKKKVRLPVTGANNGEAQVTAGQAFTASQGLAAQQQACEILSLTLGPLDLDLLGLRVQLDQVQLDITAVPGAGNLLGNLLCSVAGLLDPGSGLSNLLNNLLTGIANLLNQLLGF